MKNYLLGFILSVLPIFGFGQILEEGFDDITTLSGAGWIQTNQSTPLGVTGWFQGNPDVFPANSGATNSYIGANFNNTTGGTGTISNWLITPAMNLKDGDKLTFWTRTSSVPAFDDRLEVRSSVGTFTAPSGGASNVGSFTTLNMVINDDYSLSYPNVWTEFEVIVSGVGSTPVEMRFAFRYNVILAGPIGTYSDYIGIDDVKVEESVVVGGDPCDEKTIMSCGETYTFDLVPNAGDWETYTDVSWDYTGSEKVWEFTAPTTGPYTFDVNEGDEDADFFLMDACSNTAVNLSDGYWTGTESETVSLTGGVTYYLIADLYEFATESTTVSVSVTCPETEPTDGCEWTVRVWEDYFGEEVSWELRDSDGAVILSGGGYEDESYDDTQTVTAAGPLEFYIEAMGTWGDNEPSYTVSNGTEILVSGQIVMDGPGEATYSDLNCDDGGEEPGGGDCEQGVPSQSVVPQAFGILSSNPYRSAEDFTVEAEGFTLQQITIDTNQQSVPNAATIYIRSDVGGVPGAILHTITGAPDNSEVVGSAFGDPIIQLTFDLDTQIDLPEGTYWLDPNMTTAVSGEVVWWAADDYDSSHGANIQRSSDGGTTWTVDTDYSGVFTVSGICGDEEPGGTECDITYSGSLEDGLGNLALLTLASDFTIGADESMSVEKVTFNVFANVASVNVSFHANNAGTPGAQIVAPMSIVPTSQTLIGTSPTGSNIYEVVLDLPTAQEFEGGASGTNYWMAISTVMGSEGLGNYWEFSDSINNGTNFFYSLDGGVVWADAGPAGFVEDGAFILEGICGGDEPPTGEDCGQGDDSNGFENGYQIGSGTDFENADDFFVSAGNTLNVQTIELNAISMAGPMESIGFTFYEDNAGAPGSTVVQTVTGLVPYEQFVIGSAFGFDVYAIYVDVDLDFAGGASGTTYWMQPTAVAPGGEIGGYFWEITTAGSLGSPVHTRELAGAWTPNTGENAVFKLHCDDVVPPPPPCVFDITLDIEPITRVDVADIDHTSDATVNGSPALEDFTAVVGNMAPGESYDIALEGNTAGDFTTFFTVFIDWNQDGDWTDADEMYEIGSITNSTGTDGQQATGTIAVPAGAPEGTTVMRVIKNFNVSPTNPCGTYSFGQGEDYTINVGEVPPGGEECNQEVLSNALENGLFLGGADNQRLAVDVTVAANTRMTISAIEPTIIVPEGSAATTFGFVFYEDLGGLPGAEIDNATGTITSSTVTGQNFGRDFIRYAVDLDAPVILEAGTYWMEMTSDAEGWESTTASVLGSTLVFNNASTSGEWVNDGTGMEMVYEIVATCETLGVSDMDSFDFAYYPNPVKDVLNITSNKKVENVAVYNLAGQQVLANAKVNNGQINISALSTGVYVFRATLQGGQVETFKIIKK